jgi:hypothetical protein
VTQAGKEVNRLFKSDFFGERALLVNEPRGATVAASQATVCLVLDRETFTEVLGPLDSAMTVRWVVQVGVGGHGTVCCAACRACSVASCTIWHCAGSLRARACRNWCVLGHYLHHQAV